MQTTSSIELETWIQEFAPVADRMRDSFGAALESALVGNVGPTELSRTFNIGRTMAWKIQRVLAADDPVEIALQLPGRPTMMRLINDIESRTTKDKLTNTDLREAYQAFYQMVTQIASSHQELTAVLSVHDPRVLREAADRHRASAYRVMTDVVGGSSEALSAIWMFRPNPEDPSKGDEASIHGCHRLRRLGVMKAITSSTIASEHVSLTSAARKFRLDGGHIDSRRGTVIRELSSSSLPELHAIPTPNAIYSIFAGEDLPHGEPVDIVVGSMQQQWTKNIRPGEFGTEQVIANLNTPTKLLITDLLVHREMWPGIEPVFKAYDIRGIPEDSYPGDYWFREVDNYADPVYLTPDRLLDTIPEAPKHAEMARYLLDKTHADLNDYRIYRVMQRYPVIGHSFWVYFSRRVVDSSGRARG